MINQPSPRVAWRRGLSLLELTVVIAALLSLISILFIGVRAWKRGSDRAGCVLTIRNMQVATRSYQNLYGYHPEDPHPVENGSQDIALHLFHKGYIERRLYDQTRGARTCPAGGSYQCPVPETFPPQGQLYMACSLESSENHTPHSHADW